MFICYDCYETLSVKFLKFLYFTKIAVDQILTHWYATMLLALRYAFSEARDCIVSGELSLVTLTKHCFWIYII